MTKSRTWWRDWGPAVLVCAFCATFPIAIWFAASPYSHPADDPVLTSIQWVEKHPGTAGWAQAAAATLALAIAIFVPWFQQRMIRRDALAQDRRRHIENMRRFIAAIRAEISSAIEAADRQYKTAFVMLANLQMAGAVIAQHQKPLKVEHLIITDGIVYRQLAIDLGNLPPRLTTQVVGFYAAALDIPRVAAIGDSAVGGLKVINELAPRLIRNGHVVLAMLDNFERSDFDADADLTPTPEQADAIAQIVKGVAAS